MLITKWWNLERENLVWKYWIVSTTDEKFVSHLLRHRLYGVKRGMNNFCLLYRTYFSTYRPGLTNGHSAWISGYLSLWNCSTFKTFRRWWELLKVCVKLDGEVWRSISAQMENVEYLHLILFLHDRYVPEKSFSDCVTYEIKSKRKITWKAEKSFKCKI